ncbi:MAG: maleylpyruvate isomerase N-terminal domain-containing protein, partial [Ilumatobacteraceae bacterium]
MTVPASIVRDTGGCRDSHRDLLATLGDLDHLDPTRPSRLPGWSVGHILTHLARNADSHVDML